MSFAFTSQTKTLWAGNPALRQNWFWSRSCRLILWQRCCPRCWILQTRFMHLCLMFIIGSPQPNGQIGPWMTWTARIMNQLWQSWQWQLGTIIGNDNVDTDIGNDNVDTDNGKIGVQNWWMSSCTKLLPSYAVWEWLCQSSQRHKLGHLAVLQLIALDPFSTRGVRIL